MRLMLEEELREVGYDLVSASSGESALEILDRENVDIILTDLVMPRMRGIDLLRHVRERGRRIPVILMTAFGSIESAVESIRGGAYHYLTKPFRMEQLRATLEMALREQRLVAALTTDVASGSGAMLVGEATGMRRVLDLIARAAPSDTPILLIGESGTGKELLARRIHQQSSRSESPIVALNCTAIPEGLLESQLFGHRRGAFTDAREDRKGLFLEADGGTLFLDEIGDMPLGLQSKLLRVLQEKEVHPLGASSPVRADVRLVAATHRNLEELCRQGRFREDLYYRLNVVAIQVPPLRNRLQDLVPLVAHFLEKHGARLNRPGRVVSLEAMERLRRHWWPGNVRELENVIERALVLGSGPTIGIEDLPESLRPHASVTAPHGAVRGLAETERDEIIRALRSSGGNKAAAARMLGVDRKTLYRKLEAYGIDVTDS
jgi:two-component system response regulator HydG